MSPTELLQKRQLLRLSQRGLAEALGVNVITVSRWERGVQQPPRYVALALAELIRLSKTKSK